MGNYNFTELLSPLDFELLSKDLLEAELKIRFENFSEGRDNGIDLRYATYRYPKSSPVSFILSKAEVEPPAVIVQCKRYTAFSDLKSELKNNELAKIFKLNPQRYIITTSVSISPQRANELKSILTPFLKSTDDIYGSEPLNSLLTKHEEVERKHMKLWLSSTGVLTTSRG